jgi:hypothetical protein
MLTHPFANSQKMHHISLEKAIRLIVPKEKNNATCFSEKHHCEDKVQRCDVQTGGMFITWH